MIYTLNEPYGARAWFPCKDVPSDKADSMDIQITVEKDLIVVSNGLLKSKTENTNSTTYWWHEEYPISTYLVSLAIHPYQKFSDWYIYGDNDSMEVQYYVFADNFKSRVYDYDKTVEMIEYFSDTFGQYPFINEKYGHAEFLWSGGMEHQTITSLGRASESLIAHELAHQWWGDAVTCNSFHDLWLNEGFACYSEALWYEYAYSYPASEYQMYSQYLGPGKIYIEDLENEQLFHGGLRYDKASWVLHMLRNVVGNSSFFDIIKTYYSSNKFQYNSATTEEFIDHCNKISKMNLDKFFQQWIFGEYYPEYCYSWNYMEVDSGYTVNLTIDQEQKHTGLFWMPIDISISTIQENITFSVLDSAKTQNFIFFIDKKPQKISLDPNNWILKESRIADSNTVDEKFANRFKLFQNFPNPFNSSTTISFNLPDFEHVTISIYNILGQKLSTPIDAEYNSGFYKIKFNGTNLHSGVYFYKFEVGNYIEVKKMVLLK